MVEVVRHPFCMVSLGGLNWGEKFDQNTTQKGSSLGALFGGSGTQQKTTATLATSQSFWQVHWYKNPVIFWLEAMMDSDCLEGGGFDIGWMTELDPTWKFPEIAFLQSPESALFANPVAQVACAADCVAANIGFPIKSLFWCAGCQGSIYPYSGWISSSTGAVSDSKLLVARMQAKMHRDLTAWKTSGNDAICGPRLQPVMDKRQYKMGMTYPVPARKFNGKCCDPIGRTTLVRDSGKTFPYKGGDFAYQLFRKRDCCGAYKIGD